MQTLDLTLPEARKLIRILVYPNITFAKQIEKDSFVQYLSSVITELNAIRDDLFFTVWMPKPVEALNFTNVRQVEWPLPTHAPAMRVHFDVFRAKQLLGHEYDFDLVWSHLPEHTHALYSTLVNLTHHRPAIFGYAHWFDLPQTATWDGDSFRENISGLLRMSHCYLNTEAQKQLVLAHAAQTFTPAICQQLETILRPSSPGIESRHVVPAIMPTTEKVIVFNHRPDPYKDFPAFLKAMRELRTHRQDFTVWIPLLESTPSNMPWIVCDKFEKAEYYQKLQQCRVGVAPKQSYAGWSISATDGLMNGCPYIFYDADYYKELHPTGDTFRTWQEALVLLNRYLDDESYRNTAATTALSQASTLRMSVRAQQISADIDTLVAGLPMRQTDAMTQISQQIQTQTQVTKRQLMESLSWGRGIPWTPYRRALLANPHIYDSVGPDAIYRWVE